MKLENDVGIGGADLRHFGRKIGLIQPGIDFADNLAFEQPLEALDRIFAGLIVRRQHQRLVVSPGGRVLAGAPCSVSSADETTK